MKTVVSILVLMGIGIAQVEAIPIATSSIQSVSASDLVQQGRELYQNEQFSKAVEIWERAYTKQCGASGSVASSTNKFIITGRGGLPPTPSEVLRSDLSLVDLGTPTRQYATTKTTILTKQVILEPTPIVEAQGWVISPQGQVVLTASAPDVTPEVPWLRSPSCHNS